MKIKAIRVLVLSLTPSLLAAPILKAQDLSKYRKFSLGTNLANVLKRADKKLSDVNTTHGAPTLIQEFTWWPPSLPGTSYRSDSVEQVPFSFFNGDLYKVSVRYDQSSTEGLTAEDMMKSISAKYGPPTSVAPEPAAGALIDMTAECGGTTPRNGQQHFDMLPPDPLTVSFDKGSSSVADKIGHLHGWPTHLLFLR
jgi:hypothetical protein